MPTPRPSHKDTSDADRIRQQAQQIANLEKSVDALWIAVMDQSRRSSVSRDTFLQSPGGTHRTLSRTPAEVLLPGEAPRNPAHLVCEDNPAPDSRSPLETVISQQTAMKALVRHYGWVHHGANILFRPDWPGGCEVTSPASTTPEPPLMEMQETPEEKDDQDATAAAAVA